MEERSEQLAAVHGEIFRTVVSTCVEVPAFHDPRDSALDTHFGPEALPPTVDHLTDEQLIERAKTAANGERFAQLWSGDLGPLGSHSEADLALCSHLAFWTQRNPERIDRLFRRSGLFRRKWERRDYRERTIRRAIEGTTDVYAPSAVIPELPLEPHSPAVDIDVETPGDLEHF